MFFLQSEDYPGSLSDPADHSRLTENVARAFCVALLPHLKLLKEDGMAKLGLRVTLDSDQVDWDSTVEKSHNVTEHLRKCDGVKIAREMSSLLTFLYLLFQVGYLAGSNGQPLLSQYLSDLDSALIPVIHGGACQLSEGPVVMELIFYILEIIS